MIVFLTYDLKVAVLIAVFYMFYRLLLSRETFHRVNRVVLLLTAIASYVLPLCVITLHKTVVVEATESAIDFGGLTMMVEEAPQMPLWQVLAVVIFLLGVVATLGYTLSSVLRVWLLIRRSEQHLQPDGTVVCVAPHDVSPFSWMHYIVLSPSDYEAMDASILAHERGHIRRHHSVDLILVDTLTALQWFNPAMWMLRQDLRAIHEYEADAAVLSQGINMRQYQYLLIQKAVSHCGYSVANGISHSTLKNRIDMMLHKNSKRASLLKLLALVPLVGVALALNAETVNDYVYNEPKTPQKKIVKKGRQDGQIKMGTKTIEVKKEKSAATNATKVATAEKSNKDKKAIEMAKEAAEKKKVAAIAMEAPEAEGAFDVVEEMPQFPGGAPELMKFLSMTVKYPEAAEKAGTQGRVIASFIVEKDGSISGAKVVKNVSEELDAEALRVINAMPNWTPGKQKGQAVRVKYTIPISFRLQ
jgi:TonB family protein